MNPFRCPSCGESLANCYCAETDQFNERPNSVFAEEESQACNADDALPRGYSLPGYLTKRQAE